MYLYIKLSGYISHVPLGIVLFDLCSYSCYVV